MLHAGQIAGRSHVLVVSARGGSLPARRHGPRLAASQRVSGPLSRRSTPQSDHRAASAAAVGPQLNHPSVGTARRARRQPSRSSPAAEAGGGGGGGSGSITFNGGSGGGSWRGDGDGAGGGGDDDGDGAKGGSWLSRGWADRVAVDPDFAFKVLIEQVIGVGAAVLGDMSSRKDWGIHELDFVFSTLVVGSIMNFSLMYLLAKTPARAPAPGSGNLLARLFDENTLKRLGAPGGNFFEPGYPLTKRFLNLGYKGVVFGLVGFGAGVVGTSLSNGLIAARKKLDPKFEVQNQPPGILANAGVWGTHMGVSSNVRYQLLNGLDMVLAPAIPPGAFKGLSAVIRLLNNILGGMSFVTLAKLFNVQPSSDDAK